MLRAAGGGIVAVGNVSGLGTGVATALAVNVGTAGAPVVNGGALGTPSSGTLTNATGLPAAGVVGTAATLGANTFTGHQLFSTDNTYDIGGTGGANRPKDINVAGNVSVGGYLLASGSGIIAPQAGVIAYDGRARIYSPSDGVLGLYNSASSDFSRLQLGGITSSFPAIKRSAATIAFRLADDSADAGISSAAITASADATINGLTVGRGAGNVERTTVFGTAANASNLTGTASSVFGYGSMYSNTGSYNSAFGDSALNVNSSGTVNTAVGYQAGYGAAGVNANTTGSSNSYFGAKTVGSANNNTNETVIGANAVGNGSNTVTFGDSSVVNNFFRGALTMSEMSEPAAPAANGGVLFLKDNGAGKTQLMIRFASGASQQVAIEP